MILIGISTEDANNKIIHQKKHNAYICKKNKTLLIIILRKSSRSHLLSIYKKRPLDNL